MLTALPIVTTPVGAILEAVKDGETALVVPPKDSTALAAALRKLMNDPELAATLGMRARETAVGQFSREIMLDRMERVFHDARSA
jgi:glycosyltransferase involved in cell wall biosynthesis